MMSEWIEWNGKGAMPVKNGVAHYRQYRDETREEAEMNNCYKRSEADWIWEHRGDNEDIIAYKIVEQNQ